MSFVYYSAVSVTIANDYVYYLVLSAILVSFFVVYISDHVCNISQPSVPSTTRHTKAHVHVQWHSNISLSSFNFGNLLELKHSGDIFSM